MSNDIAIKVEGVSKSFKLPHDKSDSIKSKLISLKDRERGYEVQKVLKDISFEVKKGEFFGIVGRNGSGKSTLLKIISQIYAPDKGEVHVNGKLTPFIELGVGFNPELSGRENVFLNGALLGFSRKQMEKMYNEIVEFAELERFMDQKLKNYSSGMQVRLAFSIAIRVDSDILVLDEVLAVGDEAFQRKCTEFFQEIKKDKTKTVILVTHSMESVREHCSSALLLSDGVIEINSKNVDTVADAYSRLFIEETDISRNQAERFGSGEITIENIKQKVTNKEITIDFDAINNTDKTYSKVLVGVSIRHDGKLVSGNNMKYIEGYREGFTIHQKERKHITLRFDNILSKSDYTTDLSLRANSGKLNFDTINNATEIRTANPRGSQFYKIQIPISITER